MICMIRRCPNSISVDAARPGANSIRARAALACMAMSIAAGGCDNAGSPGAAGGNPSSSGGSSGEKAAAVEPGIAAPSIVAAAPAPPPAPATLSGPPAIEFSSTSHDFGRVPDAGTYRASFAFTNTGGEALRIESVTAGCGCTTPSLAKMLYAPGESGTIDVVFNPKGKADSQPRTMKVVCNAQPQNVVELAIHADISPVLRIDPTFVKFDRIAIGQSHQRTATFGYFDPDMKIVSLSSNNPHVNARVTSTGLTGAAENLGTPYSGTIEITVEPTAPWGTVYATRITVLAQGKYDAQSPAVQAQYDIFVTGEVFGDIVASPLSGMVKGKNTAIVSMGNLSPETPFEYAVQITRTSGQPLMLRNAQVSESTLAGMQPRLAQESPSTWRLFVAGNTGSHRGPIKGEITIDTDVQGEPSLRIRFAGNVPQ